MSSKRKSRSSKAVVDDTGSIPHLVIFDLDRTLATKNVSFAFGAYLYTKGLLKGSSMLALVSYYGLYRLGLLSVHSLHTLAFRLVFSHKKASSLQEQIYSFLEEKEEELYRSSIVQELADAQRRGATIWIQSSSPECIVRPIADKFQVPNVLASRYKVDCCGVYTEVEEVVDGHKKRKLLEEFLQKKLLSRECVTAYSDSQLDLPLLEAAGCAVAVFPDRKLKRIARERKWQVWEK